MAFSENPLIPSFLRTNSSMMKSTRMVNGEGNMMTGFKNPSVSLDSQPSPPSPPAGTMRDFVVPAPKERGIEMFSPAYYWASAAGGLLSCGLTHTAVTPLDIVKCNMQVRALIKFVHLFSFFIWLFDFIYCFVGLNIVRKQ